MKFFSMNERDKNILDNLKYIKYILKISSDDFTVEFIFKENDYFEPNILTKTYLMNKKEELKLMEASKIN